MRCSLLFLLVAMLGCSQSTASFDPFSTYGPTLVPPPPTGTAGRADPYYQRAQNSNSQNSGQLSVFTSDQPSVAVADQRGAASAAAVAAGTGVVTPASAPTSGQPQNANLQWQAPVSNPSMAANGQSGTHVPSDRRIDRATAPQTYPPTQNYNPPPNLTLSSITDSAANFVNSTLDGAVQFFNPNAVQPNYGTQPGPTAPPGYGAPAAQQSTAQQPGGWQNRY